MQALRLIPFFVIVVAIWYVACNLLNITKMLIDNLLLNINQAFNY